MTKLLLERKCGGKRYRVLHAKSVEDLVLPDLLMQHFVALIVAPTWEKSSALWKDKAGLLLSKGLCYCCTWADGTAEGLHDLFDRLIIDDEAFQADVKSVIMTTWHDAGSLEDAVWYMVHCGEPVEAYETTCKDWLCLVVGDQEVAVRTMYAMKALFS